MTSHTQTSLISLIVTKALNSLAIQKCLNSRNACNFRAMFLRSLQLAPYSFWIERSQYAHSIGTQFFVCLCLSRLANNQYLTNCALGGNTALFIYLLYILGLLNQIPIDVISTWRKYERQRIAGLFSRSGHCVPKGRSMCRVSSLLVACCCVSLRLASSRSRSDPRELIASHHEP